jgi:hypothetical protein
MGGYIRKQFVVDAYSVLSYVMSLCHVIYVVSSIPWLWSASELLYYLGNKAER